MTTPNVPSTPQPPAPPGRLTAEELRAIEARANAAPAGPWDWTSASWECPAGHDCDETCEERYPIWGANVSQIFTLDLVDYHCLDDPAAEFIAHARTDVPRLLAEVAALRAERDDARVLIAALRNGIKETSDERDYWRARGIALEAAVAPVLANPRDVQLETVDLAAAVQSALTALRRDADRLDVVERRMTRAVCVEPRSDDAWAWVVNVRSDGADLLEKGQGFVGDTFREAIDAARQLDSPTPAAGDGEDGEDEGCPVDDPGCLSRAGECHDACEPPEGQRA